MIDASDFGPVLNSKINDFEIVEVQSSSNINVTHLQMLVSLENIGVGWAVCNPLTPETLNFIKKGVYGLANDNIAKEYVMMDNRFLQIELIDTVEDPE